LPGLRSDLIVPKAGASGTDVVYNIDPFRAASGPVIGS
jgi:hypothetical protein